MMSHSRAAEPPSLQAQLIIRKIEKLITDSCRGKITEYDLWTEMDGLQEVKLYVRNLRHIIKDLLLHIGYRDLQYLHFEYREMNGKRMFGPANGGIWRQITVRKICQGHVLIALVQTSCIPRWLVGRIESNLRTTSRSVQSIVFFRVSKICTLNSL